jgi:LysM repeat protein
MRNRIKHLSLPAVKQSSYLLGAFILLLALGFGVTAMLTNVTPVAAQTPSPADQAEEGYVYVVKRGDSWALVARITGVSVDDLQSANPDLVRPDEVLKVGDKLQIPAPESQQRKVHFVKSGESWNSIAQRYKVTRKELQAFNPDSVRAGQVLYRGERILIPTANDLEQMAAEKATATAEAQAPTAEPTAEATEEPTAEATEEPTAEVTEEPAAEATAEPAAEATEEEAAAGAAEEAAPETTEEPVSGAAEEVAPEATEEAAAGAAEEVTAEATEEPAAGAAEEPTDEAAGESEATEETPALPDSYTVGGGESWTSIAEELGISVSDLQAANPDLIRAGMVLLVGDELKVPKPGEAGQAAAEETTVEALPGCPQDFGDYADQIAEKLASGGIEAVTTFLSDCGALSDDGLVNGDWTGDDVEDLAVIYNDPTVTDHPISDLLLFTGTGDGYELGYQARADAEISLLDARDINKDGQTDIVWTETTCGANTCFDTVNIRSWDGEQWTKWTANKITMAYADIGIGDETPDGQGDEITLSGGIYGSVGAGPQRSRTEVWGSVDGAPYSLLELTNDSSNCLYHEILDANEAFNQGMENGFDTAEELYTDAIGNEDLVQCWDRPNEVDELRSFAYYRLALISAYEGLSDVAGDMILALEATYPDSPYAALGQVWLDAYASDNDMTAACQAAVDYAAEHPEVVDVLGDYGFANPDFKPADVCPILDGGEEAQAEEPATEESATNEAAIEEEPAAEEAATDEAATEEAPAEEPAAEEAATTEATTEEEPAAEGAVAGAADADTKKTITLSECPSDLGGYAEAFPEVLTEANGDTGEIKAWMQSCGAMSDGRGEIIFTDLNGDGLDDALVFPTIVSDLGFGPDGSQGALLVYHANLDGGFDLIYSPEIYGQPSPLAVDDLNQDGFMDVAWTVESCSTTCVLEVQMVSWTGDVYTNTIQPGATIAEGEASFAPVGPDDPGSGQELLLEGGVSKDAEGGLAVAHTESWQSIDGDLYRRIRWTYDSDAEGADCSGLRMVEADIALQASDVLGYQPAIDLYSQVLSEPIKACSIFGMNEDDEATMLTGLASFRLMQAQALSGDLEGAQATLDALTEEQPDADFTSAATQWLAAYQADQDPVAACDAVSDIFEGNDDLWLITDQYGYNHPALAAQQLCFTPPQ